MLHDFVRRVMDHFNPRSPCGERPASRRRCASRGTFRPTLPVRGATYESCCKMSHISDQPTLPARGASWGLCKQCKPGKRFQPTLPVRGASQPGRILLGPHRCISTHAPRAGSDCFMAVERVAVRRFQPTLPVRGATHIAGEGCDLEHIFNPRSPCGERLKRPCTKESTPIISTHAPRAGSDAPFSR